MAAGQLIGRFNDFQSASNDLRLQPDPYVLRMMDGIVEKFTKDTGYLRFPEAFVRTMTDNFVEAFRRLDAIDRDHPFWDETNRRPTQYKLDSACSMALRANPTDYDALWQTVAVGIVFGASFNPELWERLNSVCRVDPNWIIYSALYAECYGGFETVPDLVVLLKSMQCWDSVVPVLEEMTTAGKDQPGALILSREHSVDWAYRALKVCGSGN